MSWRYYAFGYILIEVWILFLWPNWQQADFGSHDGGLALSRRQAIVCTNDDIVLWHIYVSFGRKGLKYPIVVVPYETWLPAVYCMYKRSDVTMHLVMFLFKPEFYSWGPFDNKPSLVWHDGLALNRRKAISCTNDGIVLWRIHASFGRKGLDYGIVLDVPCEIWILFVYWYSNILNVLTYTWHQTSLCGFV